MSPSVGLARRQRARARRGGIKRTTGRNGASLILPSHPDMSLQHITGTTLPLSTIPPRPCHHTPARDVPSPPDNPRRFSPPHRMSLPTRRPGVPPDTPPRAYPSTALPHPGLPDYPTPPERKPSPLARRAAARQRYPAPRSPCLPEPPRTDDPPRLGALCRIPPPPAVTNPPRLDATHHAPCPTD